MGFQGIIFAWKLFQNLLHSKFQMKYSSNQDDLLQWEALAGLLLEERKLNISK